MFYLLVCSGNPEYLPNQHLEESKEDYNTRSNYFYLHIHIWRWVIIIIGYVVISCKMKDVF